jgi:eukaryotic-like serine/threonine-protein kinase
MSRARSWLFAAAAPLLLLLLLIVADRLLLPLYTRLGRETTTPLVVGLPLEAAELKLRQAGFEAVVERRKPDPSGRYGDGEVMEQFPRAERLSKSGRRVHLTVCRGGRHVLLPDLSGNTLRQATVELNDRGLQLDSLGLGWRFDGVYGRGTVLAQSPAPGDSLLPGSLVSVTLSLGPEPERVEVPSLLGLDRAAAGRALRSIGLEPGRWLPLVESSRQRGVRSQQPAAGSLVPPGSRVDLWIQTGRASSAQEQP